MYACMFVYLCICIWYIHFVFAATWPHDFCFLGRTLVLAFSRTFLWKYLGYFIKWLLWTASPSIHLASLLARGVDNHPSSYSQLASESADMLAAFECTCQTLKIQGILTFCHLTKLGKCIPRNVHLGPLTQFADRQTDCCLPSSSWWCLLICLFQLIWQTFLFVMLYYF